MPKTIIAIPSYNRFDNYGKTKFFTAHWITEDYWPDTRYYVEPEQLKQYHAAFIMKHDAKVCDASKADHPKVWGSIMDLIIDECIEDCDHLVIMDDDLALAERPSLPDEPTKFKDMTEKGFNRFIKELREITTIDTPLTSGQYRQFSQGKSTQYSYNQRISMVWSLNSKFFRKHKEFRLYRQSKLEFMCDYYFFLSLLHAGYKNICINRFTKDDKPNAPGGICEARARNKFKVFNSSVRRFAAMFPQTVTVYEKANKGNWQDGALGVRIQAAKAHKLGQAGG